MARRAVPRGLEGFGTRARVAGKRGRWRHLARAYFRDEAIGAIGRLRRSGFAVTTERVYTDRAYPVWIYFR